MSQLLFSDAGHSLQPSSNGQRTRSTTDITPIVTGSLPLTIHPSVAISGFNIIPTSGKGPTLSSGSPIVPQYAGIPTTLGFSSQALLAQLQCSAQAVQAAIMQQQQQQHQQHQQQQHQQHLRQKQGVESGAKDLPEGNPAQSKNAATGEPQTSSLFSHDNNCDPASTCDTNTNRSSVAGMTNYSSPMLQASVTPMSQLFNVPMSVEVPVPSSSTITTITTNSPGPITSPTVHSVSHARSPPPLTLDMSSQLGGIPQYQLLPQQMLSSSATTDGHIASIILNPAGAAGGGLALGRMSRQSGNELSASQENKTQL